MEPTEFRRAMEALQVEYGLPVSVIQDMIFELGVISQTVLHDKGAEHRNVYLHVQYASFSKQLADPRFVAAVKKAALGQDRQSEKN